MSEKEPYSWYIIESKITYPSIKHEKNFFFPIQYLSNEIAHQRECIPTNMSKIGGPRIHTRDSRDHQIGLTPRAVTILVMVRKRAIIFR